MKNLKERLKHPVRQQQKVPAGFNISLLNRSNTSQALQVLEGDVTLNSAVHRAKVNERNGMRS